MPACHPGSAQQGDGRRRSTSGRRSEPLPPSAFRLPSPTGQRAAILALFIILCCGFFRQAPGWNENSRYDLVVALVDHHTTRIDPYISNTGDRAFYHGHYYSDKAPGSSFLVLPTYLLIRGAAALAGAGRPDDAAMLQALTFTAAALPTVVLALLLLYFLRPLVREWWALAMALGYALGTIAFPFSTLYFGHTASACLLFAAFYVLWRARLDGPAWQPLLAGFLAGWAVLVEFTAVLGAGPLLIYGLARSRRALLFMGAGALLPAALLLSYNWVSF